MKEALLECTQCRHRFVAKIFEPGEAERKGIPHYPVRCERCNGLVRLVAR